MNHGLLVWKTLNLGKTRKILLFVSEDFRMRIIRILTSSVKPLSNSWSTSLVNSYHARYMWPTSWGSGENDCICWGGNRYYSKQGEGDNYGFSLYKE